MLFFIAPHRANTRLLGIFKYISCYSLSEDINLVCGDRLLFKYISCYSLSKSLIFSNGCIALFKYISCYSLSAYYDHARETIYHLNTSHVILYRRTLVIEPDMIIFKYISCYSLSYQQCIKF